MTDHLSNIQKIDPEPDNQHTEEGRKEDYFLLIAIMVLLAGLGGYLILNPDESTLRKGTAIKEPITKPVPRTPVALTPEPVIPEPVIPEPVIPEPVIPEPVTPEPVTPEPVTLEPIALEPIALEPIALEPVALEPAALAPTASHTNLTQKNKATFAWAVNLVSVTAQSSAEKIIEQLKVEGIETEVIPVNVKGRTYYRIRIANLTSKQEANKAKAAIKDKPAYKDAWINRYQK